MLQYQLGTIEANNVDLTIDLGKTYTDINSIKKLPIKKIKGKTINFGRLR